MITLIGFWAVTVLIIKWGTLGLIGIPILFKVITVRAHNTGYGVDLEPAAWFIGLVLFIAIWGGIFIW